MRKKTPKTKHTSVDYTQFNHEVQIFSMSTAKTLFREHSCCKANEQTHYASRVFNSFSKQFHGTRGYRTLEMMEKTITQWIYMLMSISLKLCT